MRRLLCIILVLLISGPALAQFSFTISGYVKDARSGEALISANVYIKSLKSGAATNKYGFYSLTVKPGIYEIEYSYLGYTKEKRELDLNKNIKIDINLVPTTFVEGEVVVTAEAEEINVKSTEMGIVKFDPEQIKSIPVIFGEQDILKTIQLMPGVKSTTEASAGFSVRGGKSDQNLILLDEAPVYNASHIGGFFSVFNSDAIKDVKLIKGSLPAYYGGRLSSVLEMTMNEGNNKFYETDGGIGLIFSRLTFQGPLKEDVGSFLVSGRRTYFDQFFRFSKSEETKESQFYFYDLNLKANYRIGENDRLYLSGYFGRDVLGFKDEFGFDWGNKTFTLRWNHLFSDKLFSNSSFIFSMFDFAVKVNSNDRFIKIGSSIDDINIKEDFQYFRNPGSTISFGANFIKHTFLPGEISLEDGNRRYYMKIEERYAYETALYISHKQKISPSLTLDYGIRFSAFTVVGPGTFNKFDYLGRIESTKTYGNNSIVENYFGPEPRFSATYLLTEASSLKASYARNRQYIHLLASSLISSPMDVWQPSTNNVKPGIADQVAAGYFRNFGKNSYESSVEVYYKNMENQIEYRNGANIILNENVESELIYGKGWAYGIEFYLKKNMGELTGWAGYTFAKTMRKFDQIDRGDPFPARHDRTHDFSIAGVYKPGGKWTWSLIWTYHTGDAVSFPVGKYSIDGQPINYYTERNASRMSVFHRLDLSLTRQFNPNGKFRSELNLSVYNIYGRKNAYIIYFQQNEDNPDFTEAVRLSLFRFFPSLSYNFKF